MKKIIYIIIGILCLTGCWTEERNYRPKKTGYANNLFRAVREELFQAAAYLDAAKKTDLWGAASSAKEKELIEDAYFRNYKVRQRGDTISLISISNDPVVQFITRGKRLADPDAQWKIVRSFDTLMVRTQADNRWGISLLCNPMVPGQMDIVIASESQKGSCQIEGNGITRQGYIWASPIAYKTEKPVAVLLPLGQVSLYPVFDPKVTFTDGEILFEMKELSGADPARAILLQGNQYTITYKGFTEKWMVYEY